MNNPYLQNISHVVLLRDGVPIQYFHNASQAHAFVRHNFGYEPFEASKKYGLVVEVRELKPRRGDLVVIGQRKGVLEKVDKDLWSLVENATVMINDGKKDMHPHYLSISGAYAISVNYDKLVFLNYGFLNCRCVFGSTAHSNEFNSGYVDMQVAVWGLASEWE
jgi:hypothetical protein